MKLRILWSSVLGLTLSSLPLVTSCSKPAIPTEMADQEPNSVNSALAMQPVAPDESSMFDLDDDDGDGLSEAAVTGVVIEQSGPRNFIPSGPTAEIIKLAGSGVEESVMLAYVVNSSAAFNLGPEEIIYLNDIGVPSEVIMSMIQHDRSLRDVVAPEPTTSLVSQVPTPQFSAPLEGEDQEMPVDSIPEYPTVAEEPQAEEPQPTAVSYSGFYDALQPYGNWVNVNGYGRCWQPTVAVANPNWRPYCDQGRWVYTESGWYWLSGYSWGWAPFHYGRWFPHERLGWCWTPDTVWGPSWVTWRYTDRYCGWAPLPPRARFKLGVGLTMLGRVVPHDSDCGVKQAGYTFVPLNRLRDNRLAASVLPRKEVARIFDSTVVSTRFSGTRHAIVNNGLPTAPVAAATHSQIPRVPVRELGVRSPQNAPRESLEAGNQTAAVRRPAERNLARNEIRQPSAGLSEPPTAIHESSSARHNPSGSASRRIAESPIESVPVDVQPLPSQPERAVLNPVAHSPPGRSQPGLIRRANRQEIQTASVTQAEVSPGALIIRGRSEPPVASIQDISSSPINLPGQPAWVRTENPTDRQAQARTARGPRQAVLPRSEPYIDNQPPRYEPPQQAIPREVARSQPMRPAYQAPPVIPPAEPQISIPPARMPERPWSTPAQPQAPAWTPPSAPSPRNDAPERHTRPSVESRPAPAPAVEPRTGSSRSAPSSRAESLSGREDSGRRR